MKTDRIQNEGGKATDEGLYDSMLNTQAGKLAADAAAVRAGLREGWPLNELLESVGANDALRAQFPG